MEAVVVKVPKPPKTIESLDGFRYYRPRMVAFSEKCPFWCFFGRKIAVLRSNRVEQLSFLDLDECQLGFRTQ